MRPLDDAATVHAPSDLRDAIARACARIAPAWPLDRQIAVDPYWGWIDRPIGEAAATLTALTGRGLTMPRRWYRDALREGRLDDADLDRALEVTGAPFTREALRAALDEEPGAVMPHPLVSSIRDEGRDLSRAPAWDDTVLRGIGRACESFTDERQAPWQPARTGGLYAHWRSLARHDRAPWLLFDLHDFTRAVDELPALPEAAIATTVATLGLARAEREAYLVAALLSVQGWAGHFAHRRWEARQAGADDTGLDELLAVRAAWDLLLFRTAEGTDLPMRWLRARRAWAERAPHVGAAQQVDWVLQRAVELRHQDRLARAIAAVPPSAPLRFGPQAPATIAAQAVFCIDVRSEVLRRHLEEVDPDIVTLGFAGFFGLPVAYQAPDGSARPQLPGLLAPRYVLEDEGPDVAAAATATTGAQRWADAWRAFTSRAPGAFPAVESAGLLAARAMLRADLGRLTPAADARRAGLDRVGADAAPRRLRHPDGRPLDAEEAASLVADVLRAMGLTAGFAPLVVLVGHGAGMQNNPQAAAFACGACGGHAGEVNARALAALLEEPEVRARLAAHGIAIPSGTRFVGGRHDTVTDRITLYPDADLRATHASPLARFAEAADRAGARARRERAGHAPHAGPVDAVLADEADRRAGDWAEVRPEWALARNLAIVIAPRTRTRPLDLHGRVFLHEYDARHDAGGRVLEGILTAPVLVAHWISAQYRAAVTDPEHLGAGDKLLHDVVGGTVGLYEGAGGDLRLGPSRQAVHDGTGWVHDPVRLAVIVEAAAPAIDGIIAAHGTLRQLVDGEWIHLYRVDPAERAAWRRQRDGWTRVAPLPVRRAAAQPA